MVVDHPRMPTCEGLTDPDGNITWKEIVGDDEDGPFSECENEAEIFFNHPADNPVMQVPLCETCAEARDTQTLTEARQFIKIPRRFTQMDGHEFLPSGEWLSVNVRATSPLRVWSEDQSGSRQIVYEPCLLCLSSRKHHVKELIIFYTMTGTLPGWAPWITQEKANLLNSPTSDGASSRSD